MLPTSSKSKHKQMGIGLHFSVYICVFEPRMDEVIEKTIVYNCVADCFVIVDMGCISVTALA